MFTDEKSNGSSICISYIAIVFIRPEGINHVNFQRHCRHNDFIKWTGKSRKEVKERAPVPADNSTDEVVKKLHVAYASSIIHIDYQVAVEELMDLVALLGNLIQHIQEDQYTYTDDDKSQHC